MSSKLLKDAIADAKAVRATALANAKAALDEAFAPRFHAMFAEKLREEAEEEEGQEMDESKGAPYMGAGKGKPTQDGKVTKDAKAGAVAKGNPKKVSDGNTNFKVVAVGGSGGAAGSKAPAAEDSIMKETTEDEEQEQEVEENVTTEDLDAIIKELEAEVAAEDHAPGETGEEEEEEHSQEVPVDTTSPGVSTDTTQSATAPPAPSPLDLADDALGVAAGGLEGEQECACGSGQQPQAPMVPPQAPQVPPQGGTPMAPPQPAPVPPAPEDGEKEYDEEMDEEIDLQELLKSLNEEAEEEEEEEDEMDESVAQDKGLPKNVGGQDAEYKKISDGKGSGPNFEKWDKKTHALSEENTSLKNQLKEYDDTIVYLREQLNEINLLNAKLLYTNKLFKEYQLDNSKKMRVVEMFDLAKNVREAKLTYATIAESLSFGGDKKKASSTIQSITEGMASKTVTSTKPSREIISESAVTQMATRFQKLAGIKVVKK